MVGFNILFGESSQKLKGRGHVNLILSGTSMWSCSHSFRVLKAFLVFFLIAKSLLQSRSKRHQLSLSGLRTGMKSRHFLICNAFFCFLNLDKNMYCSVQQKTVLCLSKNAERKNSEISVSKKA